MKYILRYELKSKYFGFKKVYYKEFDTIKEIEHFINSNHITKATLYIKDVNDLIWRMT